MTIGETIQRLRKEKGWSQEDLAEQVGVSRQSISLWEKDQTTPSLENMKILCQLFQITMDELLGQRPVAEGEVSVPPPVASVVTHWDYPLMKRAMRLASNRRSWVCLAFAVVMTVMVPLMYANDAALGNADSSNASAAAGYLWVAVMLWLFWILGQVKFYRTARQNIDRQPNHVVELEFFANRLHTDSRSDRSHHIFDWGYREIKEVRSDGELVVLLGPNGFQAFALADLQGDSLWVLSALKAAAGKFTAPTWLLPNRFPSRKAALPGLKGRGYTRWRIILMILFLASLGCFIFAMPVCVLLSELGGLPEFIRYLWGFYLLLPIPLASLMLGCWGMQRGIKAKKNIIAGSIVAGLLLIYGSMGFLANEHSWDAKYYTQAVAAAKLELPDAASVDTLVFVPMKSQYYATAFTSSAVTFSSEDGAELSRRLAQDPLWQSELEDSILEIFSPEYQHPWGPSLFYCVELDEYNALPQEFGTYTFYYFTFDTQRQRMLVVQFQIEFSQQTLEYHNLMTTP
mgnify:CR=1 FL=1